MLTEIIVGALVSVVLIVIGFIYLILKADISLTDTKVDALEEAINDLSPKQEDIQEEEDIPVRILGFDQFKEETKEPEEVITTETTVRKKRTYKKRK